jgi:hypothetical protein
MAWGQKLFRSLLVSDFLLRVLPAMRKQREQSMAWVALVFNSCPVLPFTLPDIEVLDGKELGPRDLLGCPHHSL